MSSKLLSIIVPSYNMERYLPRCLGSLIVSDPVLLQLLDVIVVNDGSKDRTSEIAHEFEAKYPAAFQVIDKSNGNYGSCVNAGLKVAQGEFVRLLDADDWFDTQMFEDYLRVLSDSVAAGEGIDLFLNDFQRVTEKGDLLEDVIIRNLLANQVFELSQLQRSGQVALLPEITYRTSVLRNVHYEQTEGMSYTDIEWTILPMPAIGAVRYVPMSIYRYRIGREGQTMVAATYAERFWMVGKITKRLLDWYCHNRNEWSSGALSYLKYRMIDIATVPYKMRLIGDCGHRVKFDLVEYDAYLLTNCHDVYDGVESAEIRGRIAVRYVREWRTWHSSWTPRLILFRTYSGLAMSVLGRKLIGKTVVCLKYFKRMCVDIDAYLKNLPYELSLRKSIGVMTREETLRKIIDERLSICRYGDDEFRTSVGRAMSTQIFDEKMQKRLVEILGVPPTKCLCGIPSVFGSLRGYSSESRRFWRLNLRWIRHEALPLLWSGYRRENVLAANSQISRCYTDMRNKNEASRVFDLWKELFGGRDILLVEGRYSRLGYGSDLLSGAKSIRRIWGPHINAFAEYDRILGVIKKNARKDDLILLALGGTATILAYDLAQQGYWAVDAGNVDLEYVWMKMGTPKKVPIPGRFIIECSNGRDETRFVDEEKKFNVVAIVE